MFKELALLGTLTLSNPATGQPVQVQDLVLDNDGTVAVSTALGTALLSPALFDGKAASDVCGAGCKCNGRC